jgi:hypothetical protein
MGGQLSKNLSTLLKIGSLELVENIKISQPRWKELASIDNAKCFCEQVGYVLSGAAGY